MSDGEACLACDLTAGRQPLPGGTVHSTPHWTVEHCIGPLGLGTLIVKPLRHTTRFADLTPEEATDFGPLLHSVTNALADELGPDQTYICQWSHAGWTPGHIHFVVQPVCNAYRERFARSGPFLQADMFDAATPLDTAEVAAFCERIRRRLSPVAEAFQPRVGRANTDA
ncbi:MAG: hypothetical protein M3O21_02330 [Chloroflexota bacterium]|nr:hypothetical protein [Chloroflexota bacterium]